MKYLIVCSSRDSFKHIQSIYTYIIRPPLITRYKDSAVFEQNPPYGGETGVTCPERKPS